MDPKPNGLDVDAGEKAGKMISAENGAAMMEAVKKLMDLMTKAGIDTGAMKDLSTEIAEKCYAADMAPYAPPPPFGGATSFADIDSFAQAREQSEVVNNIADQFQGIWQNVMGSDDISAADKAKMIAQAAREMQTRIQTMNDADEDDLAGKSLAKRAITRIGSLFGKAGKDGAFVPTERAKALQDVDFGSSDAEAGGGFVFQDKEGTWRWLGIWSNDRKDREQERFPLSAHEEFIGWTDETKQLPELWGWHTPGSRSGVAEMVDVHDGFTIAAGTFDPGMEDVALRLSKEGSKLGMSHGYVYRPSEKVGGEIRRYRTFEVSYLPREKAANEGTAFVADKEAPMNASKEQWLRSLYGDERVDAMKGKIADFQKSLGDDSELGMKDVIDALLDPAGHAPAPAAPAATVAPAATDATKAATPASDQAPAPAATAQDTKALGEMMATALKAVVDPLGEKIEALAGVPAQLAELKETQDAQATQLAALKEADDVKIAAAFAPRAAQKTAFASATDAKGNEASDDEAKRIKEAAGDNASPVDPYLKMISHAGVAAGA